MFFWCVVGNTQLPAMCPTENLQNSIPFSIWANLNFIQILNLSSGLVMDVVFPVAGKFDASALWLVEESSVKTQIVEFMMLIK